MKVVKYTVVLRSKEGSTTERNFRHMKNLREYMSSLGFECEPVMRKDVKRVLVDSVTCKSSSSVTAEVKVQHRTKPKKEKKEKKEEKKEKEEGKPEGEKAEKKGGAVEEEKTSKKEEQKTEEVSKPNEASGVVSNQEKKE